jgi:hypothetical protein
VREHEIEPVWGLPERPPTGETILWQGAPEWRVFARRAMHVRGLALYFALLIASRCAASLMDGASLAVAAWDAAWFVPFALAGLALVVLFAWLAGRTSAYTITNRRVVLRVGIALSMTANIPFDAIQAAAVKVDPDGSGDITLTINPANRVSYLFFWPHVRPWHYARPEPALRSIPDAAAVAQVLSRALAAAASMPVRPVAAAAVAGAAAGPQAAAA